MIYILLYVWAGFIYIGVSMMIWRGEFNKILEESALEFRNQGLSRVTFALVMTSAVLLTSLLWPYCIFSDLTESK